MTRSCPCCGVFSAVVCVQVGMHFMHPVSEMPLVELARGMHTSNGSFEVGVGREEKGERGDGGGRGV